MVCTSPYIHRRKGHLDIVVPCGRCIACRKNRVMMWANRCLHESAEWEKSVFVTLTYSDDNLPEGNTLVVRDLQLFIKRFRKRLRYGETPRGLKYLAAGEYGDETKRPHYHLIMFGVGMMDAPLIREDWGLGFIYVKPATYGRMKYTCKYVLKKLNGEMADDEYLGRLPPFQVQSRGIGEMYVEKNQDRLVKDLGFTVKGNNCSLSRYYRNKLGDKLPKNDYTAKQATEHVKLMAKMLQQGATMREISTEFARLAKQKATNLAAREAISKRHN